MSAADTEHEEGSSKRRRIALACRACRTRKSRCDGQRPICSACKELNFDCVYIQSSSSSNIIVGKEYLSTLEERLAVVEKRLNDIGNSSNEGSIIPGLSVPIARFEDESVSSQTNGIQSLTDEAVEDETDGMGAMVFTEEDDSAFFGPSSNIAFTRHISRAISRLSHAHQDHSSTPGTHESLHLDGGLMNVSRPPSPIRPDISTKANQPGSGRAPVNPFALPPEPEALDLIRQYFQNTGVLFPFLHEASFLETYEAMKRTRFTKVRRTWLGLFNILLAFGQSTSKTSTLTAEERAEASEIYYQRAVKLCENQILRGTSLELVQYLLLMGQYLQGTQRSSQIYMVLGLAIKASFQLGLHSRDASKRFSPLEQEIRKRTFYGVLILDRTLSMTFGRPAAIPEAYVKLDLPVDFDEIHLVRRPDPRKHLSVQFYNATISLYNIMYEAVNQLYGGNLGCESPDSVFDVVTNLFKMEHQLDQWQRHLPPNMVLENSQSIPGDHDSADPAERFRVIITLRYHNLRLLIHRLVIVRFLDTFGKAKEDSHDLEILQQAGANSFRICAESAFEIISIVSLLTHSNGQRRLFLGFWWYSLYYTFNAALVIFATIIVRSSSGLSNLPLPEFLNGMSRPIQVAVEALNLLDPGNRMVEKCTMFLERLDHILSSLTSSPSQPMVWPQNIGNTPSQPFQGNIFQTTGGAPNTNVQTSPLGMDLGEFMLESDLDFLNYFRIPPSAPANQNVGVQNSQIQQRVRGPQNGSVSGQGMGFT